MTSRRALFACVIALAALLPASARAQIQPGGSVLIDKTPIVGGTTGAASTTMPARSARRRAAGSRAGSRSGRRSSPAARPRACSTTTPACSASDGGTGILSSLATVCNPSDARLKTAWLPLDSVLEKVALLDLGTFDWRDVDQRASAGRQVGLRAQDVARVFPLLVGDEGGTRVIRLDDGSQATVENIRTVDYPKLAVYALKGVQGASRNRARATGADCALAHGAPAARAARLAGA
jgi:hypothetical protein